MRRIEGKRTGEKEEWVCLITCMYISQKWSKMARVSGSEVFVICP